jgi:hypothetical protein
MGSVRLLSSSFAPAVTPDPSAYHPPTLWCRLLCHLLITIMIYLPSPAAPPNSCIILLHISQFDHFSAYPLKSDDSQLYPMHMKHNGASKTLILLIDGVYPISDLIHCKLLWRRQQSGRYSTPAPPPTAALPQNVALSPLMR